MPELPEVETIKDQLKKDLMGKKIINVQVLHDKIIEYPKVDIFIKDLKNQTFNHIARLGKWLIFELDDYYLLSHLRMEGKYIFNNQPKPLAKHDYVIFTLEDNFELKYRDTRKFGKMLLVTKDELYSRNPIKDLGVEPFSKDLTVPYLKNKFKNKTIPIKTALLDQKIIAGIGNIYASEILFLSKINPLKKTNQIKDGQLQIIIDNTRLVLSKAIKAGGTTVKTYTWKEGEKGLFQSELAVYDRKGKPCLLCQTPIEKITVNKRGTYYCSRCQK